MDVTQPNSSPILNSKGEPYPDVTVDGYGKVPFPDGPYTPNNSASLRPEFNVFIKENVCIVIYSKSLLKRDETYYRDMNVSPWINGGYLYFTPADSLPSSDCWLKEEKWIWRNEQDWKDYMERIKEKKKKK